MNNNISDRQKLDAIKEMCEGLNHLEELGLINTAPNGEDVYSTPKGNTAYLLLRRLDNIKFGKEHGSL